MKKLIHDAQLNEYIERDMTDDELEQLEKDRQEAPDRAISETSKP